MLRNLNLFNIIWKSRVFMKINNILSIWGIFLIRAYKSCISPYLPRTCRHAPTCSSYAMQALQKYSFFKGSYLILNRLLRCNPLGSKGFDPVP